MAANFAAFKMRFKHILQIPSGRSLRASTHLITGAKSSAFTGSFLERQFG